MDGRYFYAGNDYAQKERDLQGLLESKKENWGTHGFCKDNNASVWEKCHTSLFLLKLFVTIVA